MSDLELRVDQRPYDSALAAVNQDEFQVGFPVFQILWVGIRHKTRDLQVLGFRDVECHQDCIYLGNRIQNDWIGLPADEISYFGLGFADNPIDR